MAVVDHPSILGAALPAPGRRAGLGGALRSEWTKIRSVRSTVWTLLATAIVTIGISTLFSWGQAGHMDPGDLKNFDAVQSSLFGLVLGQLVIVVIGAMTITSEYSTGMIRTSLTVLPRRGPVYTAKLLVFAAIAVVTGVVCSIISFLIGQQFFAHATIRHPGRIVGGAIKGGGHMVVTHQNLSVTLSDPHVLRAVIGGGLFLAVSGLLAFGLGAILRHTAGAITSAIGLLFILFIMVNFMPASWKNPIDRYIPFNAGSGIWSTKPATDIPYVFSPWVGFAIFAGYAAAAIAGGWYVFRRRDA